MQKIILDTNFLLIPSQFKVDIFSEIERICHFKYKLFVLDKSISELKNIIANKKGKTKTQAKIALELVRFKRTPIMRTQGNKLVDDYIVEMCKKGNYIVATQDTPLKKRLKPYKTKIISLRQKKYLILR